MIPNYSSRENYDKLFGLGVTMFGQMTAGSYCYIGPQGIVHGTTLTVLNAARRHLKTSKMSGRVFVTSGLGGMSGAQAKAATICGCIGVIAEVCIMLKWCLVMLNHWLWDKVLENTHICVKDKTKHIILVVCVVRDTLQKWIFLRDCNALTTPFSRSTLLVRKVVYF